MPSHSTPPDDPRRPGLRRRAESALPPRSTPAPTGLGPEAAEELIHELQVHQVELELQNQELRRANAATDAARAQLADLFDLAPVGYLVVTEAGLILDANQTVADLLREPRSLLRRRPLTSLVASSDQDLLYLRSRELFDRGRPLSWELRLHRREGPPVWVRLDATLARHLDGSSSMRVAVTDLTERRQAEHQLRQLGAAIDQAPVAVLITSPRGVVEYLNPALQRATGLGPEELLGKPARALLALSPEHDPGREELLAALAAGRGWEGRLVGRGPDGGQVIAEVAVKAVRGLDGEVSGHVALARDVTGELALQQRLAEAQKLESVGRLAAGVAHDFNNLLAVVMLSAGELLETPPPGPDAARDLAREIRTSAERASHLTRQLLAFARKQVFEPRAVDLNATVAASQHLLARLLGEDITLETHLAPDLPAVYCDPAQLDQVILNLALNARDAMPRGGRLELTTSLLGRAEAGRYHDLLPGAYGQLAVSDSGAGMAPEVLGQVFEPFFTTKRAGKGTGLGLATAHGILAQAGGAIRCESTPGAGTTFLLCLPLADAPAVPAPSPVTPVPRAAATETLLLVEDEHALRRVAVRALEGAGYRVLVAPDGLTALALAARERGTLDLVLTDVIMPGMDGGALAAELATRYPGLPVLFLSGYTDEVVSDHGVLRPGVELLAKPFTGAELLARVRGLLDRRAQSRSV